ncbi:MAG: ATP-binding protein [Candidatus Omnitrophota bacterium]
MTKVDLSELHKDILNDTLVKLKGLLRAESASLFLFDPEHQELVLNSIFDERKVQFRGLRQRMGEGIAGSVANECKAVLVKDIKTDPRFRQGRFRHYHTNSFICVPILTEDSLIGVINISDKVSGEMFTEDDFNLACLFAQLASRMVENQITLAKLREENELLKKEKAEIKEEHGFLEKFASMGKLAGGIVHEINNPLDAVMRYTNMIIEKDLDPSVAREYLNEIKVGLTRILKITRSLLEFSQQLNDNNNRETADVNEMVEEALSLFRHTLFLGHVKVEKHFSDTLPKIVDKGLCRVFSNFIKNAFDAMPDGGTLSIMTSREDGYLSVSFKDTGCGIADDIKEKIFSPFFTTKPIGQGVGLGLPICFEVVQRYEGKIDVKSEPGQGAEFNVRIPIKNFGPQG